MTTRHSRVIAILGLLLTYPILRGDCSGRGPPGITVPAGTKLNTLKYSDTSGTAVQLKPAEQVAFLFVYGIQNLESIVLARSSAAPAGFVFGRVGERSAREERDHWLELQTRRRTPTIGTTWRLSAWPA